MLRSTKKRPLASTWEDRKNENVFDKDHETLKEQSFA